MGIIKNPVSKQILLVNKISKVSKYKYKYK